MPLPDNPAPPDWVSTESVPNTGLDLTGLRLPILTIGAELLDGITTVTPSVRYLSLYAWMLSSYAHAKLPDTWNHFQQFAEKVESAIAIGNIQVNPQGIGLVGAQGATRLARESSDSVSLAGLVKQPATAIYLNPSIQLQFLFRRNTDEAPGLSRERGEPLAQLIRTEVSKTQLGRNFSAAEIVAEADREDLREFGQVANLATVPIPEGDLLVAGIIPIKPRTLREAARVSTYASLLGLAQLLKRPPTEDDFFGETLRLERSLPQRFHAHLDSWLRHLTRDALAVGHEYVLQEVLHVLGQLSLGKRMIHSSGVISELSTDSGASDVALRELGLLEEGEEAQTLSFAVLFARVESIVKQEQLVEAGLRRWNAAITELKLITMIGKDSSIVVTLLPLVWCVAMLRGENWPESDNHPFEGRAGFGWDLIGVHAVIIPEIKRFISGDFSMLDVMKELAMRTVDQHLRVSWSRMAADSRHDVALLIADGEEWQSREEKHVQNWRPGRTDSRIGQAINWLRQLGLVHGAGLTQRGTDLYTQLCNTSFTPLGNG